jgi:N-acetylmuramoyl-L-alanine amidase
MQRIFQLLFLCVLVLPPPAFADEKGLTVKGVRFFSYAAFTRIVFEIETAGPYVIMKTPDGKGLLLAAYEGPLILKSPLPTIRDGVVGGVETTEDAGRTVVLIRLDASAGEAKDFVLRGPDRIVLDIAKGTAPPAPASAQGSTQAVVVLDAGHGGRDTGIVTAQGLEKAITLELAHAVKKNLLKHQHIRVVLTRDKDASLTLDDRSAAANAAGALLFVSIHAAAGAGSRAYIQDPGDDPASKPYSPVTRDFLGFEAGSEQREKLWNRQQAGHAKESGSLGRTLSRVFAGSDSEPVQAPMAGLRAVDAAAVLIEIGTEEDRGRTAEAVARGIELYVRENR